MRGRANLLTHWKAERWDLWPVRQRTSPEGGMRSAGKRLEGDIG